MMYGLIAKLGVYIFIFLVLAPSVLFAQVLEKPIRNSNIVCAKSAPIVWELSKDRTQVIKLGAHKRVLSQIKKQILNARKTKSGKASLKKLTADEKAVSRCMQIAKSGSVADGLYTLNFSILGNGSGLTMPRVAGQSSYPPGAVLVLFAFTDGSSNFAGWGGALRGTKTVKTLVMNGDKEVSVTFMLKAQNYPTPTPVVTPTFTPTPTATVPSTPTRTPTPTPTGSQPVVCNYTINAGESINKYSNIANPGQTVCIRAGTYRETLTPQKSGSPGNLITFRAYQNAQTNDACKGEFGGTKTDCRVIIEGQGVRDIGIDAYPHKFVRFEGFEIRNHTDDAVYLHGYYDNTAEGLQVVNNYIHDNGNDAISFRGDFARNILVENNEIFRNSQTAISSGGGSGHIMRGNNIHYNGKDGVRGGGANLLIEFNRIYDQFHTENHQDGLDMGDIRDSIIRYNTIYDLTQLMYFHDFDNGGGFHNLQIYGNVLYTDRYWTVQGGEAPGIFLTATFHNSPISNIQIHSNTIGWVGYGGVWIFNDNPSTITNIKLYNNIFFESGVDIESNNVSSNFNVFYNVSKPSYEGQSSVTTNPQFVNYQRHSAWDFRLKAGSPAIDRGSAALGSLVSLPSPFIDLDHTQRPTGARYDIGAYEYIP